MIKRFLFFCLLLSAGLATFGQKTRVGLCLSGGGAKGLAHIGLLKVIDSAGIKVDYITGTSMGAVLGGMYAIGYSGNDIEKIARDANWRLLLSNDVPMTEINVEEKDEFDRYLAELPMKGLKPGLPLGAIEGQELNKMLGDLTFPVHQISHFDSLPIPFRCIGADILTGEAVVLSKGYLPTAMRASMAIPSVFTPVKWQGHLLVDGGLVRNFPVTDLKEMGADIVIGGYTGGRLFTEEELTSPIKLLYQSASFNRVADSEMQKSLCDLLADYDVQLQEYSAASFSKIDSIIDIGYRIALQLLPDLKRLADSLKMAGNTNHQPLKRYYGHEVCLNRIILDGACEESKQLVLGKMELAENTTYSVSQINEAIQRVYGTRFFDKVYYTFENNDFGNDLVVHIKESRRAAIKFALHYDNEQAAGIILNLTARNVLGSGSRALATFDISEYPKFRINYQKFIDSQQKLWLHGGYHYEFIPYRLYNKGRLQEELTNSYNNMYAGINYTLTKNSYLGAEINNEWSFTRTKIYPEDRSTPDSGDFRSLNAREWAIGFKYFSNTLNRFLFPTRGNRVKLLLKVIPGHTSINNFYTIDSAYPTNNIDVSLPISPAIRFSASIMNVSKVNKRISWINSVFLGLVYDIRIKNQNDVPYSAGALPGLFFAGGVQPRQRDNLVSFLGYRETELVAAQMLVWQGGLQTELLDKLFITPGISFLAAGGDITKYVENLANFNLNYQDFSKGVTHAVGYGITFAYNWFGGPVSLTVYRATGVDVIRGYFTYGYKF